MKNKQIRTIEVPNKKMLVVLGIIIVAAAGIFTVRRNIVSFRESLPQLAALPSPEDFRGSQEEGSAVPVVQSGGIVDYVPSGKPVKLPLQVTSPMHGDNLTSPSVVIKGVTASGAEVFINDEETIADGEGNFQIQLTLEEGDNYIIVVVTDAVGNMAEQELTVYYSV
jgi:hypothetical protein